MQLLVSVLFLSWAAVFAKSEDARAPFSQWRVDTIASVEFLGTERLALTEAGEVVGLSGVTGTVVFSAFGEEKNFPHEIALPVQVKGMAAPGEVVVGRGGYVWIRVSSSASIALLKRERNGLSYVKTFDLSSKYLAIAELAPWGKDGVVARAFAHRSGSESVVDQRLVLIEPNSSPRDIHELTPYTPDVRTRIRLRDSLNGQEAEEFIQQPFRPGSSIALGNNGAFAIADPVLYRVQVGKVGSRSVSAFGDSSEGETLTNADRETGKRALMRIAARLKISPDSLPWSLPERRPAIAQVWLTKTQQLVVRRDRPDSEVQVIDIIDSKGRKRTFEVPPRLNFRFAGFTKENWHLGMVPVKEGRYKLVRIRRTDVVSSGPSN